MAQKLFSLEGAQLKDHNSSTPIGASLGQIVQDGGHLYMYVKATAAIAANEAVVMQQAYSTLDDITGFKNTGDRATGQFPYVEDSLASWTVGDLVGSYLYIDAGTGAGQLKRIVSNTATRIYFAALHPGFGTSNEDDPFSTAPDITSDITIVAPFHVVKVPASTLTSPVIGYAPFAFTSGYYGWICITGIALIKSGTTAASLVAGVAVSAGDNTAGQLTGLANGETIDDIKLCGIALHAAADDQAAPIWLAGNIL